MTKKAIQTTGSITPQGAYSQGIRAGDFIFVAGHMGLDPLTQQVVEGGIEEQTARALENIQAVLEAGGASMGDVVKTTVHLTDMSLFPRFNQVYAHYFPDPKPARTTVGSILVGVLVEIEAIAYVGKK